MTDHQQAAIDAARDEIWPKLTFDKMRAELAATEALAAALPFLEEQIRKQIAAEVRLAGKRTSRCLTFEPDNCDGCAVRDEVAAFAAEIAEGFRS